MLAGFTVFQEMSTSATDNSLIPMKKAFWTLHFSELSRITRTTLHFAHFTNHHFWFFTECVACIILLQIGLKCAVDEDDSRSLFTRSRTRKFSACFTTAMWQSRHSEVDVHVRTWSASTFPSASLSWSKRLTDTGTQLGKQVTLFFTFFDFLNTLQPDCCSDKTGLPVLT